MNWEQIRDIINEGMEIGSHSLTHYNLNLCSPEILNYEIGHSKHILEQNINQKVKFFAYPFGKLNNQVKRYVEENGYIGACVAAEEPNKDRGAIGRITVENGDEIFKVLTKMKGTYYRLKDLGFISTWYGKR
jgi:peptidoglycan/xylan/chitin deacetylase (PgdA/CDA1 family)